MLAEDDDGDSITYSLIDAPEGAIMDSTTLIFIPSSTGLFHIIITACDSLACDTCDFYVAVDSCGDYISEKTSIPDILYLDAIPNPFNSTCAISAPSDASIEIYDLNGKCVETFDKTPCVWTPNEKITSGVYLIRATKGGEIITKRVILMR